MNMVYLSIKKINGKRYTYLVKAIRTLSGVTTITKLLSNKEQKRSKKQLEKKYNNYFLKKEQELNAKEAVKKFKASYVFSKEEIAKLEEIKVSYKYLLRGLTKLRKKDIFDRFTVNFTYDSNAIEGNSLTLKDVSIVIDKGSVKGKELREIYETLNSRKAVDLILKRRFDVTEKDIIRLHRLLMKDIDERKGYKQIPNIIYRADKPVQTVPPEKVKSEMEKLILWHDKNKDKMHPLELAALFHGKFESIHPFEDGNGRVGRFLINVILANNGYPPLIIRKTNREQYMNVLAAFDSGYEDKLKRFLLRKYKDTFRKFFEIYVKYV